MERKWSELPPELLSEIAEALPLIDLLGFRGVCKDWNSATSAASAKIESSQTVPWFLVYGESSQCPLLTNEGKRYTITIPELEGATCLASSLGWLLIFQRGNMFFFCPFSRARIDLPEFPQSELSDHVAAFISPPTNPDSVVAVIHRRTESHLELNIIRRGEKAWTKVDHPLRQSILGPVKVAAYHKGLFQLLDDNDALVTFTPGVEVLIPYKIIAASKDSSMDRLEFRRFRRPFLFKQTTNESGLDREYSCIDTCGTLTNSNDLFFNERVTADCEDTPLKQAKGVWIQPRFHQISARQRWAL